MNSSDESKFCMNFGSSVTASIRQFRPLRPLMVLLTPQASLPRHKQSSLAVAAVSVPLAGGASPRR
jgi:hypothetical protein